MDKIRPGSLKAWLLLPRFHFIPLTVILVSLGTAIGAYEGFFHLGNFLLAMVGSILVHITVNVINDYYDYVGGIDLNTQRTPFSGGSGRPHLKSSETKTGILAGDDMSIDCHGNRSLFRINEGLDSLPAPSGSRIFCIFL